MSIITSYKYCEGILEYVPELPSTHNASLKPDLSYSVLQFYTFSAAALSPWCYPCTAFRLRLRSGHMMGQSYVLTHFWKTKILFALNNSQKWQKIKEHVRNGVVGKTISYFHRNT